MNVKQAIAAAKAYVADVYADESITNLGLEETEHDVASGLWNITLAFARPWNTPRSRAQEMLESLGGVSPLKRTFKVVSISENGEVVAMKDPGRLQAAE